jgi:molybdenum cofactor cytidylyltransferase
VLAYREKDVAIVASEYEDTIGVPALFDRSVFPDLLALAPDQGCKGLLVGGEGDAARIPARVPCPEAAIDVDTPADYRRFVDGRLGRLKPAALRPRSFS